MAGTLIALARHPDPIRLIPGGRGSNCSNDRSASASLRTLVTAQIDFRVNDRDGNGIQDFWTGDIAGLYTLEGADGLPIRLIELSVAGADVLPATDIASLTLPGPKAGYSFIALRPPDEADWWNDGRFGACCYPSVYGATGLLSFIIGEQNILYRKDLGRAGGISVWPKDPEAEGWEPVR